MSSSSATKMLHELAVRDLDKAAEKLALANKNVSDSQETLTTLNSYREDYLTRYNAAMNAGISIQEITNYQRFIQKLDQAISGQEQTKKNLENLVSQQLRVWQQQQKKKLSYDVLLQRVEQKKQALEAKQDQKMMDEFASRAQKKA